MEAVYSGKKWDIYTYNRRIKLETAEYNRKTKVFYTIYNTCAEA